jgi:hypothetical protein
MLTAMLALSATAATLGLIGVFVVAFPILVQGLIGIIIIAIRGEKADNDAYRNGRRN